jgi:hypothetical protein
MSFRYRLHRRGLAAGLALLALAALASALWLPVLWRVLALALLAAAAIDLGAVWVSSERRAFRMGSLRLDEEGVWRINGDGRVLSLLRWECVRGVQLDRGTRQMLFRGPDATSIWCHGPNRWGGVGLERFDQVAAAARRYTRLPVVEPGQRPRPRVPVRARASS